MEKKKGIIIALVIVLVIILGVALGIFLKKDDVKVNGDENNIIVSGDIVESGEKEEVNTISGDDESQEVELTEDELVIKYKLSDNYV